MHVAIGSENPVKVAATERVLERYEPTVTTVAVDSGVAEQPRSVPETITGATNRARRARSETDAKYGVGLEGGVARLDGAPWRYLVMWAAATDGERLERGGGPSIRLPAEMVDRIDAGEELGPVVDDVLGTENAAERAGAIGALTAGLTDRTGALAAAVACAVGPFVTEHYD